MDTVVVMLSTYNGKQFLREQLDSIYSQKKVHVKLVVRDDGSSDGTIDILKEYKVLYPDMELHMGENVGYIRSFMWLVQYCTKYTDCYYSFSDQDDIWDEEKLFAAVERIRQEDEAEAVLYYSDLKVVDADGIFIRYANTWESSIDKYKFSMFIGIRGCTIVYNQKLQDYLSWYQPVNISGHDTYVALTAFWIGKVVYDETPHINYRQTGNNLSITGVNRIDKLKKNLLYVRKRLTAKASIHEINAREVLNGYESVIRDADKLRKVSDYKKALSNRIRLILDRDFWDFSMQIRIFNLFFIIFGKL